jgi:hypothetical protein
LRAHGDRPCGGATQKRDNLTPSHCRPQG